jgi:hypothetical protein
MIGVDVSLSMSVLCRMSVVSELHRYYMNECVLMIKLSLINDLSYVKICVCLLMSKENLRELVILTLQSF